MSTSLFARQGNKLKWLFYLSPCEKLFYEQGTKCRLFTAVQHCVFIKDKDKCISKGYEYETSADRNNNVYKDIGLKDTPEKNQANTSIKKNQQFTQAINKESLIQKKVERLYPQPKTSVLNIYALVSQELNNRTVLSSNCKQIKDRTSFWQATFNVKWPEAMTFNALSRSKTVAFKNAALKCLLWLETNGKLRNGKPIIYSTNEMKENLLKPIELSVTPKILKEMEELIETYNTGIQNIIAPQEDTASSFNISRPINQMLHPILEKPIADSYDKQNRNDTLKKNLLFREIAKETLPIFEFRDEILSTLQDNRVLLIEGDTGCGKTTQVPQFIMDYFARAGKATDCNILVSQPRRISAISLAGRIAYERKEQEGDVVGFHVRLEQMLPRDYGAILFCTTGILLRKLQSNPGLLGCSHVILDEAHERHIDTDMLLILLKRALKLNPDLRVLIMSATLNAHLFQKYFDCASVKVPGRLHPVQMHFMEDIQRLPNINRYQVYDNNRANYHDDRIMVDFGKTVQIIRWISEHKPPGAILCFLPGWNEITHVQNLLEKLLNTNSIILPIHSKMSYHEQRKIFQPTSPDIRKIILATDIAETGITVSDVVYVVDSGICKQLRWSENKDLPYMRNCWISQANIQQRKGRAGRVRPGESYHLITKRQYKSLESYPMPQILCSPLEKVTLDAKTYSNEKAEVFLSELIEPPSPTAIQRAVSYLTDMGFFDDQENLTVLGKRSALFPTHPKISKALVYSSIFNCIHPIITIASIFSGQENLFAGVLGDKAMIRKNKTLFHPSSDHISLAWIFKQWAIHNNNNSNSVNQFCWQMKLRPNRVEVLSQVRSTFIQQLIQCRMLNNQMTLDAYSNFDIALNKYETNDEMIRAVLYSATQQLIEHKGMGYKNGIPRKVCNLQTRAHARAMISGESVNYKRKLWPSPFATYLHSAHCENRRSTVVRETSIISPLSVLLFTQGTTECRQMSDNMEILMQNNKRHTLRFSCDLETSRMLFEFKDIMWSLVQFSLERQGMAEYATDPSTKHVFQYKDKFFDTLSRTLNEAAESIEQADYDEGSA